MPAPNHCTSRCSLGKTNKIQTIFRMANTPTLGWADKWEMPLTFFSLIRDGKAHGPTEGLNSLIFLVFNRTWGDFSHPWIKGLWSSLSCLDTTDNWSELWKRGDSLHFSLLDPLKSYAVLVLRMSWSLETSLREWAGVKKRGIREFGAGHQAELGSLPFLLSIWHAF